MKRNSIKIILLIFLFASCNSKESKFDFTSKWQSLNDGSFVIEIDENENFSTYRNGKTMIKEVGGYEELKTTITKSEGNWYSLLVEDPVSKKEFVKGRIEVVSIDRIRVYFHKHHDILDLADEFHRTNDFSSFDEIMKNIRNQPEIE